MKNFILLLILQLTILTWSSSVYARCSILTGKGCGFNKMSDFDPFNKDSSLREELDRIQQSAPSIAGIACLANAATTEARNSSRGYSQIGRVQKYYLRQKFGSLVDDVVIIWNADLNDYLSVGGHKYFSGSEAQTYGYHIFISGKQKDHDFDQTVLLAHELTHVKQYIKLNRSLPRYCKTYMHQWFSHGLNYYKIPMEKEAYKADEKFEKWLSAKAHTVQGKLIIPKIKQQHSQNQSGPNLYALVCIRNETNNPISYGVRWGYYQPNMEVIPPGYTYAHAWRFAYPNQNMAPGLMLWYDYSFYPGYQLVRYDVKTHLSAHADCSSFNATHAFRVNGNGQGIQLFNLRN